MINGVDTYRAFNGVGAAENPGRWNIKGSKICYTAQAESLATLESLVYVKQQRILHKYRLIEISFDDIYMKPYEPDSLELEQRWNTLNIDSISQEYGERYREDFLALQVPSVHSGTEFGYVLNPYHEKFSTVKIGEAERFIFDPRYKE